MATNTEGRTMDAKVKNLGSVEIEGAEPGAVYLLTSSISDRAYGLIDLLHVMSKPAGGEIRGYYRAKDTTGPWKIRHQNYTGDWPEMDAAVSALVGAPVDAS